MLQRYNIFFYIEAYCEKKNNAPRMLIEVETGIRGV